MINLNGANLADFNFLLSFNMASHWVQQENDNALGECVRIVRLQNFDKQIRNTAIVEQNFLGYIELENKKKMNKMMLKIETWHKLKQQLRTITCSSKWFSMPKIENNQINKWKLPSSNAKITLRFVSLFILTFPEIGI